MIGALALSTALLGGPAVAGSLGGSDRALDDVYQPRRVAVLVGVDAYDDPDLPELKFAGKDARDLAGVLGAPELGGFDRVVVLAGAELTSTEQITRAIDLATSDLQRDDTFLLYMSGHGTLTLDPIDGTQLWFLPSDGQLSQARETGLAVDWLETRVASVPARRRVMILDTCHNGREKSSLDPATENLLAGMRGDPPVPRTPGEVSESEARLFAAQYYQPALEDPNLENGVYTHYLIQALSTESDDSDLNRDGLVDVAEAHDWARDRTIAHTGGMQVPRAEYRIVGREEIFLAGDQSERSDAERALLAATDALLARAELFVDGVPRGALPDVVPVDPGAHKITLVDDAGRTLLDRRLYLSAGETVMVEDLFYAPRFEVLGGALYRHGPGAGYLNSAAPELELTWLDPWSGPRWMGSDLHLRASTSAGVADDLTYEDGLEIRSGEVAFGASTGWQYKGLRLGPVVEISQLWRHFEDRDGAHNQGVPTLSAGLRTSARLPVGRNQHLAIRYDARILPYTYQDELTRIWSHSLGAGIGF